MRIRSFVTIGVAFVVRIEDPRNTTTTTACNTTGVAALANLRGPRLQPDVHPSEQPAMRKLGDSLLSMRSLARKHHKNGVQHDLEVEHKGHVFEVVQIVHHLLLDILNR